MSLYTLTRDIAPTGGESFREALKRILDDGQTLCDFTVFCGSRKWSVHRIILAASSRFFEKLCTGTFAEAQQHEAHLDHDDPDDIDRMIRFFYTETYSSDMHLANPDLQPGTMLMHARMAVLADKYDCADSGYCAFRELVHRVDTLTGFHFGRHGPDAFATELQEALPFIYGHSSPMNDRLRKAMAFAVQLPEQGAGAPRQASLRKNISRDKWEGLMQDFPEFVLDVLACQLPQS